MDKHLNSEIIVLTRGALDGSEASIQRLIVFAESKARADDDIEKGARGDYIVFVLLNVGDARFSYALRKTKRLSKELATELIDEIKHMKLETGFEQTMDALSRIIRGDLGDQFESVATRTNTSTGFTATHSFGAKTTGHSDPLR